jgi:hypothetical protein
MDNTTRALLVALGVLLVAALGFSALMGGVMGPGIAGQGQVGPGMMPGAGSPRRMFAAGMRTGVRRDAVGRSQTAHSSSSSVRRAGATIQSPAFPCRTNCSNFSRHARAQSRTSRASA